MSLDQLLLRSSLMQASVEALFSAGTLPASQRMIACSTLTSLVVSHGTSIKYLVAGGLYASAAALVRVQYETLVRALWVLYVASEDQAELMASDLTEESAKRGNKIPMLSTMLDDIEIKAPHAPIELLKQFKIYSWKPLSSFVHGGIHAVNRHGHGFPQDLVEEMVRLSNGLLGIAGNFVLILAGTPAETGQMAKIYAEFSDCLPSVKPQAIPS